MNRHIVDTNRPVTLLGGANILPEVVHQVLAHAPNLVAADGGARVALDLGHVPQVVIEAVIGDFDSIDAVSLAQIAPDRLHRISEQDSTDFEKCLTRICAPLILAAGFSGGRLDHELAVYNVLLRYPQKRCVVVGDQDLCFLAPLSLQLDLPAGSRISLFAFGQCQVTATGLRWPLSQTTLAADGLASTSNAVLDGPVDLQVSAQKLLVILPRSRLDLVVQALAPAAAA
jgi:thiamine pyrophosphokinase